VVKALVPLLTVLLFTGCATSQPVVLREPTIVEAACGECLFGLKGDDCDLAVRIGGRAYFVAGTNIDQHGDAHAADGFCKVIRRARVTGEVKRGRFVATSFELLPAGSH